MSRPLPITQSEIKEARGKLIAERPRWNFEGAQKILGLKTLKEKQACADQLVINQVGGHANEGEILFALANDFVTCGKRDEMSETLERNRITVANELVDGLGEGGRERIGGFRHVW